MHMHEDARILMNANEYANTLTDGKAASVARNKKQVPVGFEPRMLQLLDALRANLPGGPSRNGLIEEAVQDLLDKYLSDAELKSKVDAALKPKIIAVRNIAGERH
jgi:hypothetical protein